MNLFVAERFVENIRRLALGLQPIDACQRSPVVQPLAVDFDNELLRKRQRIDAHSSGAFVLLFDGGFTDRVDIRIHDPARRFVARRLRIPLRPAMTADTFPPADRVRRPVLFPGAAYDLSSGVTGLRGRVLRGGAPARWARVEALRNGNVLARAHGDDRGEFLLVLDSAAVPPGDLDLTQPLRLSVVAKAPQTEPVPNPPDIAKRDQLWDLPLEVPASINNADPVRPDDVMFRGALDPQGYDGAVTVPVDFRLSEVISGIEFSL